MGADPDEYVYLPVHPRQWENKTSITFAADIAQRHIIHIRSSDDDYQPQQSIRTFFNRSQPSRNYVKTALSVLNMGFMRGLSPTYMAATPAINDWVYGLVENDVVLKRYGFSVLREIAAAGYHNRYYEAATEKTSPYRKMLSALWRESPVPTLEPDSRWDAAISKSSAALSALASGTPLVPTLSDGQRALFRGAVVSAPLSLEDGLEVWDALEILTAEPSFVGLATTPLPIPAFTVDNSRGDSEKSAKLVG